MKVYAALLKREWLEHRGAFIWSPLVVFALIVVFGITMPTASMRMFQRREENFGWKNSRKTRKGIEKTFTC